MHTLKGHNFLIFYPFLTILMLCLRQEVVFNFYLDTINKGTLIWISSKFEFLCVWKLTCLLNALVNNKTLSLLNFYSDGTTNIIITNIRIADLHIANIGITNIKIPNQSIANIGVANISIAKISLANIRITNIDITIANIGITKIGLVNPSITNISITNII